MSRKQDNGNPSPDKDFPKVITDVKMKEIFLGGKS
jgi:hypothetical protein